LIEIIERLRKNKRDHHAEMGNPIDKIIHDFVILIMIKLLESQFPTENIFANHPKWKNGSWITEPSYPVPDIALGELAGKNLISVFEVETRSTLLNTEDIISRLKYFNNTYIEMVIPGSDLAKGKRVFQEIPVQGFWLYTVDREWKLTINKDPENRSTVLPGTCFSQDLTVY